MVRESAPQPRVPGEERVFSLILALVASPIGLTKSELLSTVYGYAGVGAARGVSGALERQFERDKDQIRSLGIPIETIDSPGEPGNNQRTRYRIVKHRLQLPADIRFTREELGLLGIAALAWQGGSLGKDSRWAQMKLSSLGQGIDVRHLGVVPNLGLVEPAALALRNAIESGSVVTFDYRLPDRAEGLKRRVAPLLLHRQEGRWHLIGHDMERSADRVFLLSRIISTVKITGEKYSDTLLRSVDSTLRELTRLERRSEVMVRVQPGTVAQARLEGRGRELSQEPDLDLAVSTIDEHELATELAGFGDEVYVMEPEHVSELTFSILSQIRASHTDPSTGGLDG